MRNVQWRRDFDKGPGSCWTIWSSLSELLPGCSNVNIQSKQGRANNVVSSFCDANVNGCSSTWVYADIVGRNVVGQKTMNMKACVPICRKEDKWNAQFKTAEQLLSIDIMTTESKPSSSKAKQTVLDLTSPANRTAFGELKMLRQKRQTFLLLSSFMRTDCRLMLLICRVSQLWLTYALNRSTASGAQI